MKIGIVTKYLGRPVGLGTYASQLLDGLAELAPDVRLHVFLPFVPTRAEWPSSATLHAPRLPRSRWMTAAWELLLVPAAAAREGVDLLHYLYPGGPLPGVRRPTVITLHDAVEWRLPGYRRSLPEHLLLRRQIHTAAAVVTPSESSKADIHQLLGVEPTRIAVTPLAGPEVATRPREELPYWLFVGGTERRKNLRLVLEALARDSHTSLRLKVVGPQAGGRRFERRTDLDRLVPPSIRARIDWLGQVEDAELARLYEQATALLYPSLAEGFGLPVLEAMARCTPVIAGEIPALRELAGNAALLVDPRDPDALAAAMQRVASDAGLRRALVKRGLAVAGGYSWRETARRTLAVYRRVLEAASSS